MTLPCYSGYSCYWRSPLDPERVMNARVTHGEEQTQQEREEAAPRSGRRRVEERSDDVVDVRHRRLVDGERPRPVLVDPQRAVPLPETPERAEHCEVQERATKRAPRGGETSFGGELDRDRRHG